MDAARTLADNIVLIIMLLCIGPCNMIVLFFFFQRKIYSWGLFFFSRKEKESTVVSVYLLFQNFCLEGK